MTLEITERDKKIIVIGATIVVLVLLVFLALMPLIDKGRKLSDDIVTEQLVKQEKEVKVGGYPGLLGRQEEVFSQYGMLSSTYYPLMGSQDIDRLMTGIALENNAYVENLQITMPDMETYAAVNSYNDIFLAEGTSTQSEAAGYDGTYCVKVDMTLSGNRKELQNMIDMCMAERPKQQVISFSLNENSSINNNPYSLALSVNLYMCEDIDTYIAKQKELQAKAEAEEKAGQTAEATTEPLQ